MAMRRGSIRGRAYFRASGACLAMLGQRVVQTIFVQLAGEERTCNMTSQQRLFLREGLGGAVVAGS
eukprot:10960442-Alexandrium_andersonii.AAC.1